MNRAWNAIRRVSRGGLVENIAVRLKLPYMVEFDLAYFRALRWTEISAAYCEVAAEAERGNPSALARRGRLRRLLGDCAGARVDLQRSLAARPRQPIAMAWLAELDLDTSQAEKALLAAAAALPADTDVAVWLGVSRLCRGRTEDAARGLSAVAPARRSALCWLLLGLAKERTGSKDEARKAYARAALLEPSCSAAPWLVSRLSRGSTALEAVHGVLDAQPGYAFLAQFMAHEEGSWPRAVVRLRRFAFASPDKACWYDRQDDLLYSPFHEDEYRDALGLRRLFPRATWATAMLGRAALRCPPGSPHREEGVKLLFEAARRDSKHGWIRAWRGLAKLARGDEGGALADFTQGLKLQPWYHRAWAWRGAVLGRMGCLKEAERDLSASIAIDEGYVFAYHQRSLVRRARRDWLGAAADLERAFEADARYDWTFTSGRGPRREEVSAARRQLDAAVRAYPDHPGLRAWLGQLRLRAGDVAGALPDLESAAASDPSHALSQAFLGRACLAAGRPARAVTSLKRASELRAGVETYGLWLAEAHFAAGDRVQAFDRLALIPPGRRGFQASALRARLRLDCGDASGALRDADACLRARGRSADAYYLRARALAGLRRWGEALEACDAALYASAIHGQARLARAEALRHLDRDEEALNEYREIERSHPYLLNEEQHARWKALIGL